MSNFNVTNNPINQPPLVKICKVVNLDPPSYTRDETVCQDTQRTITLNIPLYLISNPPELITKENAFQIMRIPNFVLDREHYKKEIISQQNSTTSLTRKQRFANINKSQRSVSLLSRNTVVNGNVIRRACSQPEYVRDFLKTLTLTFNNIIHKQNKLNTIDNILDPIVINCLRDGVQVASSTFTNIRYKEYNDKGVRVNYENGIQIFPVFDSLQFDSEYKYKFPSNLVWWLKQEYNVSPDKDTYRISYVENPCPLIKDANDLSYNVELIDNDTLHFHKNDDVSFNIFNYKSNPSNLFDSIVNLNDWNVKSNTNEYSFDSTITFSLGDNMIQFVNNKLDGIKGYYHLHKDINNNDPEQLIFRKLYYDDDFFGNRKFQLFGYKDNSKGRWILSRNENINFGDSKKMPIRNTIELDRLNQEDIVVFFNWPSREGTSLKIELLKT